MRPPDRLDAAMSAGSRSREARLWRGFIAHSLLFYRQNNLPSLRQLEEIGRWFSPGPGGDVPRAARSAAAAAGPHEAWIRRGLLSAEPYWGSLRLGEGSRRCFARARELSPQSVWGHLLEGMSCEMLRRYARAIACFDRAAALEPRWSWPLILRGICLWYMAEFKDAAAQFERAARLDGGELPLLFLARAKSDLRDRTLVADLDRAVRIAPRSGFAWSWRGRALFVLRRTPEALEDLRRSIDLLPLYDRGYSWLGISLAEQGRLKEALPLLRQARLLNRHYPTTLYPLARCCVALGLEREGERALREAAAVDGSGVWVEHRISMGHPNPACQRSLSDLDALLARRPRLGWALAWRGQTNLLLGRYRAALRDLGAALALDSRDGWARLWRGETLRRLGLFAKAEAELRRVPLRSQAAGWALAARGHCLLEQERPQQALALLERSLRLAPRCAEALGWRGRAKLALGDLGGAVADLEEARELRPRDRWLGRWLWQARAAAGDLKGACAVLRGLVADGENGSAGAWAALAWAEGRRGAADEALAALSRATRIDPAHPLVLRETADWWRRRGESRRARSVAEIAGARAAGPVSLAAASELSAGGGALSREALLDHARRAEPRPCFEALRRGDLGAALAACPAEPPRAQDQQGRLLRGWLKLSLGDGWGALEEAARILDASADPCCAAALELRRRALKILEGSLG